MLCCRVKCRCIFLHAVKRGFIIFAMVSSNGPERWQTRAPAGNYASQTHWATNRWSSASQLRIPRDPWTIVADFSVKSEFLRERLSPQQTCASWFDNAWRQQPRCQRQNVQEEQGGRSFSSAEICRIHWAVRMDCWSQNSNERFGYYPNLRATKQQQCGSQIDLH